MGLKLFDGGFQLRQRGADVGELDDVGLGLEGERSELGKRIGHPLGLGETVRELGKDSGCE
ncbi:unannotated protein [freshwater metagenome]|uniref:Unannotated protein n=1 Tax=freshwater metagenome TaxID=449393 RepID=A0A6J6XCH7_9ZZZZ